jgi:hypothetical protein
VTNLRVTAARLRLAEGAVTRFEEVWSDAAWYLSKLPADRRVSFLNLLHPGVREALLWAAEEMADARVEIGEGGDHDD